MLKRPAPRQWSPEREAIVARRSHIIMLVIIAGIVLGIAQGLHEAITATADVIGLH